MRLHWAIPLICVAEDDRSGLLQSELHAMKFNNEVDCSSGKCHPKTPELPTVTAGPPPKPFVPVKPVTTPAPFEVTTPKPTPPVKPSTTEVTTRKPKPPVKPSTTEPKPKPPRFNCMTRELWSKKKNRWCCKNRRLGCEKKPPAPTKPPAPIGVKPPMGLCTLKGDPHIKTFDRTKVDRHFYNYGDYWLVKRDDIWVQARYWSTRPDGNSAVRMLAISEPKVGGSKMVLKSKGLNGWEQIVVDGTKKESASTKWTSGKLTHEVQGSQHTFTYNDFAKIIVNQASLLNVMIEMPAPAGVQTGHCGNFNGNAADDVLSNQMVSGPQLLFDARTWTTLLPKGVQCSAAVKQQGQNFCSNKYEMAGDNDPVDIAACVVDYCGAGQAVAQQGLKFDLKWHAEMKQMIKKGNVRPVAMPYVVKHGKTNSKKGKLLLEVDESAAKANPQLTGSEE